MNVEYVDGAMAWHPIESRREGREQKSAARAMLCLAERRGGIAKSNDD